MVDSLVVGGAERVVEALCLDLPRHDIELSLGCLRAPGPIGESLRSAGVEVHDHLAPARKGLGQLGRLRSWLRRRKPHVVYALDHSNVLFYGRLAARLARVPVQVCAVHRTGRADGSPSLGTWDRRLMRLSDRVIAVSEGHRRYLAEEEGVDARRLVAIHNGVDPARFEAPLSGEARARRREEYRLPPQGRVVAVVAALRPEKNHRLLLEAMVRIPEERRPHLAVVGDGALGNELRVAANELGLRERVSWLGRRDDVPRLLACIDLVALSSHPMVETFPLCILEAMAASLPVVCTDVGSLREMVEPDKTGRLVPAGRAEPLAQAIDAVLGDPALAARMGTAGRARLVSQFTRARMVERTATLLWELVREKRHRG